MQRQAARQQVDHRLWSQQQQRQQVAAVVEPRRWVGRVRGCMERHEVACCWHARHERAGLPHEVRWAPFHAAMQAPKRPPKPERVRPGFGTYQVGM